MRKLLSTTDQRRLSLIEILLEANEWVTIAELANKLNSSARILKNDIAFIRQTESKLQIETSNLGVRLLMDFSTGLREFYASVLKSSLSFQILEEIFFNENLSVSELAKILHTSNSTVYRTIDLLNSYFNEYQCQIESAPCHFVGDEQYIRSYYLAYFKEISTVLEWPFRNIAEQDIDEIVNIIEHFLINQSKVNTNFWDFAIYGVVKKTVTVSIIRYRNGNLIDTSNQQTIFFDLFFKGVELFLSHRNNKFFGNLEITPELIYQIFFPYINENFAYGTTDFEKFRQKNTSIDQAVSTLENQLLALSKNLSIDIDLNLVITSIYGATYIEDNAPNALYILYNRNKLFAHRIQIQYPNIYQAIYQAIIEYRQKLNLSLDDNKIYFSIFTLINAWENLQTELQQNFKKYLS